MVKTPEIGGPTNTEIFSKSQIICFLLHVGLKFYFTLLRVAALFNSMAVFCLPKVWRTVALPAGKLQ